MKPDENQNRRMGAPHIPKRTLLTPSSQLTRDHTSSSQAAANVVRSQLDALYSGNTTTPTTQTTPVAARDTQEVASPYQRTHTTAHSVESDQWKQYHSAWQEYYQKYYERYYMGQVYQAKKVLEETVSTKKESSSAPQIEKKADDVFSQDEALYDLKSKLVNKMQTTAKKARKSRHFVPITAAICVMLVFLFLQYNRVLFANVQAYISPGNIDPANIIVNPTTDVAVSPEPKLIIPKINVDVPVEYNTAPDYDSQMKAMENGVAYFGIPGANSKPGQVGNTVLSGHSSNDIIDQGNYKFIFARLEQLANGDTIYINYEGKRYSYVVSKREVVKPTEVNKLVYKTDKPVLTLITCTPIGTSRDRLLVTAEQVSPDPKAAKAPSSDSSNNSTASIPGNSPTFLQRLFGGGEG